MSAGHHSVHTHSPDEPEYKEHSELLQQLLDNPQFAAAVAAYKRDDSSFDVPFLGGSNNAGDTVYIDRSFSKAVDAGQIKIDGKPVDPRHLIHLHEAVEGACIRLLHCKYDKDNAHGMPGGHEIATWAEHRAALSAGIDFKKYQQSLKPWIKRDEAEKVTKPPPDLLEEPYVGTKQDAEVKPKGQPDMARYEGSPEDIRADAREAKKRGMSQSQWESSAADKRMDARMRLAKAAGGYVANPAGNSASQEISRDKEMHPRQHALAMASATHLMKMGHITPDDHARVHRKASAALAQMKRKTAAPDMQSETGAQPMQPFGAFAPQ